jgi:hypothetical protein
MPELNLEQKSKILKYLSENRSIPFGRVAAHFEEEFKTPVSARDVTTLAMMMCDRDTLQRRGRGF